MRLGILSDTHDHLKRTGRAVQMLRDAGAEALVHCGDLTGTDVVFACAIGLPVWYVYGNNDADAIPELHLAMTDAGATCLEWGGLFELSGKTIGLTHGHMDIDMRRIMAAQPDYLFSGHSHLRDDRRVGQTRRINPGALHRAPEYTVALLDFETDELSFLTVPKSKLFQ